MFEALLLSAAFRFRGGWLHFIKRGTTTGRLLFALACGLLFLPNYPLASAFAMGIFLACLFPLWNSIDLGRIEGNAWKDRLMLSVRGLLYSAIPAFLAFPFGFPLWFALVGLLMWPLYELGWKIPSRIKGFERGPELGEAFFGFTLGIAIWTIKNTFV